MKKVIFSLVFFTANIAFAGPFLETSGNLWLPFWGSFRNNHNLGFALHVRAGWDFRLGGKGLELPGLGYATFGAFAEGYHTWNSLKERAWETSNGETIKSGNIYYFGVGGKATLRTKKKFSLFAGVSLGVENEYKPEGNAVHGPPKNEIISWVFIGGGYHGFEPFYLFVEYEVAGSSNYDTGWNEIGAGVGFVF